MPIDPLLNRPALESSSKIQAEFTKMQALLKELRKRELPEKILHRINGEIQKVNAIGDEGFGGQIRKSKRQILRTLEKELKLVPKNYYRTLWTGAGMGAFGVPFGTVFGILFENMAFIGIGIPIGMAIGIAVGSKMDQDAADEGRQLDI